MIEVLEARIAPAAVLTFTDTDGDLVKIKSSVGTLQMLQEAAVFSVDGSGGTQLIELQLGEAFKGAKIDISAKKVKGSGDGFVNVGYINATGVDLGSVRVDGDLGAIDAGNPNNNDEFGYNGYAFQSLTVHSLGAKGTDLGSGDSRSEIEGLFGKIAVATDIRDASLYIGISYSAPGPAEGEVIKNPGHIVVGGSLIGSELSESANISGRFKTLEIGGDVVGGAGDYNAVISAEEVSTISIGGSLIGGSGTYAGLIVISNNGPDPEAGDVKVVEASVFIGGSILGGSGDGAGQIQGTLAKLIDIGGSLVGGTANGAGFIMFDGIDTVRIGGDIVGGSVAEGQLSGVGAINAMYMNRVEIGGSIIAGIQGEGADLTHSGAIVAYDSVGIGSIEVGGSLVGNATQHVWIMSGIEPEFRTVALGSLTVGGDVVYADILAGYSPTSPGEYSSGGYVTQIGTVTVAGDWVASNLVATVAPGENGWFGDGDDSYEKWDEFAPLLTIGSVTIGGSVLGTAESGDHYGFVAEEIGSFSVGGVSIALAPGAHNDSIALADDTRILEI